MQCTWKIANLWNQAMVLYYAFCRFGQLIIVVKFMPEEVLQKTCQLEKNGFMFQVNHWSSAFLIWYHRFQIKLWKCLPLFICIISFISILSQNVFLLHRNFSHSIDCIRHMCVGVESQWRNPLSLWHFPEKSHRRLLEKSPRCLLSNIRYFTSFKSLDNSTGNQLLVISCNY